MEHFIAYAKHIGANQHIMSWCRTTLARQCEGDTAPPTEEVEHILDYLVQSGKRVERMSYTQAKMIKTCVITRYRVQ